MMPATPPARILHLTSHLGGGVGKALAGLIGNRPAEREHHVVCLERPEKIQFAEQLRDAGCPLTIAPGWSELAALIAAADIVQLEWWGHPALFGALCAADWPAMRLLLWCHVSGVSTPVLPQALLAAADCGLFTSPASLGTPEVAGLSPAVRERLGVVHSAGGFAGFEPPVRNQADPPRAGYLGSFNYAKLHPCFIDFLAAVPVADFRLRMIGDPTNRELIEQQAAAAGVSERLEFCGFTTDVAAALAELNIFPYPLNPQHYGTTENALLEAMAMGVVPVVLDNPAERCLVADGRTGLVVSNPQEFGAAVARLWEHPAERLLLAENAMTAVRERFAVERMLENFAEPYRRVLQRPKRVFSFSGLLGHKPADWFLSCQRRLELFDRWHENPAIDPLTLPGLLERTKGSVFHFQRYFPADRRLAAWANWLAQRD